VEGAQAASKDLQSVHTDLTMHYRVDQAINRWDGKLPTYMGTGAPLPFLNIEK
jgi:hypothetical protein